MWEILTVLLSGLMSGVLEFPGAQSSLGVQGCALFYFQEPHIQYQVTDGEEMVLSTWDSKRQLVSCSVEVDKEAVQFFLSRCMRARQDAVWGSGYGRFAEAKLACVLLLNVDPLRKRADTTDQHTRVKRGFTYPGTLWCGAGNNAEEETDLGEHRETDMCCRTHDQCEHVIHPFTYSYGYRNFRWHTISHCQCDNKFKECLRKVNDTVSRVVGQAFFNVIQVQCFDLTYKEQCVERHWYGWCKKYKNESVAVPRESGLYDYGGNIIDQPANPLDRHQTQPLPVELSSEPPTIGQVIQATEDLLKIMVAVSPSTSPDQYKVETTMKKKDKTKKKGRKHKKGKGLKGKRKNQSKKETIKSPNKEILGENMVKKEVGILDNHPLDSVLDIGHKQDPFNDILNDEPVRNADATTPATSSPTYKFEEFKAMMTSLPPESRPCIERPQKKNRQERKGKRQRKKKPKTASCVSTGIE
ncbi:protein PROCA1 [Pseudophryne corroboree]|uniref:protein PROCA1 n=1 Tax=Pseudophryne corroboree TaxID=495146 RepID=UPI003081AF34